MPHVEGLNGALMNLLPWRKSGAAKQNEKRSGDDLGLSLPIPGIWGQVFGFGQNSDSGEVVTPQTAMQVSTVWSCVRIIAESVGSLPCVLYSRSEGGRQVAFNNRFIGCFATLQMTNKPALCFGN
jgi:phage portal protein BeeE